MREACGLGHRHVDHHQQLEPPEGAFIGGGVGTADGGVGAVNEERTDAIWAGVVDLARQHVGRINAGDGWHPGCHSWDVVGVGRRMRDQGHEEAMEVVAAGLAEVAREEKSSFSRYEFSVLCGALLQAKIDAHAGGRGAGKVASHLLHRPPAEHPRGQ